MGFVWCFPGQTEYITDKDLPDLDIQDVAAVPDVMWNTAGDLVSANDAIPLTDYLQDLPKVAKDKPEEEQVNRRRLMELEPAHRTDGFATKILGCKWTLQYKSKAYDTENAKRFCTTLGFNSMASFAIAKFCEDVANRLALEWVAPFLCGLADIE